MAIKFLPVIEEQKNDQGNIKKRNENLKKSYNIKIKNFKSIVHLNVKTV